MENKDINNVAGSKYREIEFIINDQKTRKRIRSSLLLIDMIREELSLTGTKPGCMEGECGACTVLIDGAPVNSCLYLAVNINGRSVTTIEGLVKDDGSFDKVQEAMIRHGAVQCGFCSAGMIMTVKAFYDKCRSEKIVPDRRSIKKAIEGNLCRCTGYVKIVDAVESLFVC